MPRFETKNSPKILKINNLEKCEPVWYFSENLTVSFSGEVNRVKTDGDEHQYNRPPIKTR